LPPVKFKVLFTVDEQQQQQSSPPHQPAASIYQESSQGKNAKWLWILIILIIIGAVAFAIFRGIGPFSKLKLGGSTEETFESPTPFEFSSPSPEASPAGAIDRSDAKVRVLNGSGVAGAASSLKDFLEGKGWTVDELGNADSYDFTNTVIRLKASFANFQDTLFEDLSSDYSVEVSDDSLEATDSADIEVTLGSK